MQTWMSVGVHRNAAPMGSVSEGSRAAVADEVDRAAHVDVDEVDLFTAARREESPSGSSWSRGAEQSSVSASMSCATRAYGPAQSRPHLDAISGGRRGAARGARHRLGAVACDLHAEHVLGHVPPQQRPLARLAVDEGLA